MSVAVQDSLLDFGDEPTPTALRPERVPLTHGAWVDVQRGWLAGSAGLFGRLVDEVPWKAERRRMYDRTVDVPRLLCFYGEDAALPDPVLDACRDALTAHYRQELGEPFRTAGLCFYRDGRDSVAMHGDTIGRGSSEDTMVAIVSLGEARPLVLRPRDGGAATLRYNLGHGDLIVMGGSCQRTWEHGIPKSARPAGPRISVQFRPHDVR
ncbi:MAG TPA: alpha-ketoglutarate-dependent dioxygenase AlkB [Trebonia sp.]|jgi:alkylated DNA repair dioxygenase AlkB|nr:alpha-ketoglutarate-dependent dioxygenase AlkB [Trebonia sp.]